MEDILIEIAHFLPPNPALYFKLAQVSTSFYRAFTSDAAWRYLDPYGWETDIFHNFKTLCTSDDLCKVLQSWDTLSETTECNCTSENLFIQLGAIVQYERYGLLKSVENDLLLWCAINLRGETIKFARGDCLCQRRFAMAAAKSCGSSLEYLPFFKDDEDVVLAAVSHDYDSRSIASTKRFHCYPLKFASQRLRGNRAIVMRAVQVYGMSLEYAGEELRQDWQIVREAVSNNGLALQFCSLRGDNGLVLCATAQNADAMMFASLQLRKSKEIMMQAVSTHGLALQYASDDLKNDRELVSAAVDQNVLAIKYSRAFHDDWYIMLKVIVGEPMLIIHASKRLLSDHEFLLTAIKQNAGVCRYYTYFEADLRGDKSIIKEAMCNYPDVVSHAPKKFRIDMEYDDS